MNLPFLARRVLQLNEQAQALHLPTLNVGTADFEAFQKTETEYQQALTAFLSDPLALAHAIADQTPAQMEQPKPLSLKPAEADLLEVLIERRGILTYDQESKTWLLNGQRRINKKTVVSLIDRALIVNQNHQYVVTEQGRSSYAAMRPSMDASPLSGPLRHLARKWKAEAQDEPFGSPSHSALLYCADGLEAVLEPESSVHRASGWKRNGNAESGFSYEWNGFKIMRDPDRVAVWRIDHATVHIGRVFHSLTEAKKHCEHLTQEAI